MLTTQSDLIRPRCLFKTRLLTNGPIKHKTIQLREYCLSLFCGLWLLPIHSRINIVFAFLSISMATNGPLTQCTCCILHLLLCWRAMPVPRRIYRDGRGPSSCFVALKIITLSDIIWPEINWALEALAPIFMSARIANRVRLFQVRSC